MDEGDLALEGGLVHERLVHHREELHQPLVGPKAGRRRGENKKQVLLKKFGFFGEEKMATIEYILVRYFSMA